MAENSRSRRLRRHRARRRRAIAAAVGAAVIGTGSAVGIAATTGNGPARRVATVATSSVTQTVESSGTVTSALKLTPSFPTSGTVKSVNVEVGDTVTKGEVLAQLDTTALQAAVDSAQSALATAKQRLEADETGQTSAASGSASSGTGSVATSAYVTPLAAAADVVETAAAVGPSSGSGSPDALIRQVKAAQQAVIDGQQKVDAAQSAVDTAQKALDADVGQNVQLRDAQQSACATPSSSPSPSPSSSGSSASVSDACAAAMAAYEASADTLSNETATLDSKLSAQAAAIAGLDQAIGALDRLVEQLQSTASAASGSGSGNSREGSSGSRPGSNQSGSGSRSGTGSQPRQGSGAGGSAQSGTSRSGAGQGSGAARGGQGSGSAQGSRSSGSAQGSGNSQPASAAQLAADQAEIDSAQAQVTAAGQNLAAATLKSPASGKVAAVGLSAGSSSSGETITIIGTDLPGVQAAVPLPEVGQVKVGQQATVSVDGVQTELHGTVQSVGLLSSTSGSTTTFPVTIELDATSQHLFDGAGADVVITTGAAKDVITVPNSAVHTEPNGTHHVTLLSGGKATTVPVTLGLAGEDLTQVTSGLKVGDQVVIAELSQPLPSSANSGNVGSFRFPGFGRFGGGARRAGG